MTHLPVVAVTMGDPAGIGPEIVVKALARAELAGVCRPLVVGDRGRLARAAAICGLDTPVVGAADPADAAAIVVDEPAPLPDDVPFGVVDPRAGEAAYRYVVRAVELATRGRVQAICTAPLNKEALHRAGHRYPGHTELLAELTGTAEVSMMLTTGTLRVIHVTTHLGLLDAIARIDPPLVYRTVQRGWRTLVDAGLAVPRVAVCGINPHAGEHGLFGHGEEEDRIVPALERCRAEGMAVVGPLPADAAFFRAVRGDFDLVVAMYHDQGHVPVKALGVDQGVNITVGLPVIRTSVDHGTAFDIAGTGTADERSLVEAIRQAAALAHRVGGVS